MTTATGNQPGISRGGTDSINSGKVGMGDGRQCKGVGRVDSAFFSFGQQELHLACVRCWLSMLTS